MGFRRVLTVVGMAIALVFACAGNARAIDINEFTAQPADLRAGAFTDITIGFRLPRQPGAPGSGGGDTKDARDLQLDLPAGLIPQVNVPSRCSLAQFNDDDCPSNTEVGETLIVAWAWLGLFEIPLPVFGSIYNLEPNSDEPARLGIVVRPAAILGAPLGKLYLQAPIALRDDTDYGVRAFVPDIPRRLSAFDIRLSYLGLKLRGQVENGPFITNPTSCKPAPTTIQVTDYEGETTTAQDSFTPTDCENVPFQPTVTTSSSESRTDTPTELTVNVEQPVNVGDRVVTMLRSAEAKVGPGFALNPAVAPPLKVCTDEAFGADGVSPRCPPESQVGTVSFTSPPVGTLPGKVFFSKDEQNPYRLLIVAEGFGVVAKLRTILVPDPATGDFTLKFPFVPEVPFSRFNFVFTGGPRGGATTPLECGISTTRVRLDPYSGVPSRTESGDAGPFSTDGKGACTPTLSTALGVSSNTSQARGDISQKLEVSRAERDRPPTALRVVLPQGLLGRLQDVPPCPENLVPTGKCPDSSRIGSVTAAVGSGPITVPLPGVAYLAGQTDDAVARIVIRVPGVVGPVDVGDIVQVAKLNLDPDTSRVVVTAPNLPQLQEGIPTRIRNIELNIDRPGFLFNASGCDVRGFDLEMEAGPLKATAATPYQATGCDRLPFGPSLAINTLGKGRQPGDKVGVQARIGNVPVRSSGLKAAQVVLPRGLRPDPKVLLNVCRPKQLAAQACPERTRVGTATARTPLLATPLTGPVYLALTGKTPKPRAPLMLPYAVAFLQNGPTRIKITGSLAQSADGGRLDALFRGLPDVPLDEFRLNFQERLFTTASDLCSTFRGPADAEFDGQSGKTVGLQPDLSADACNQSAQIRMSARGLSQTSPTGTLTFAKTPASGAMTRVQAQLPGALRTTGAKRSLRVTADGARVPASRITVRRGGRGIVVRVPRAAARVSIAMRRGSLRTTAKIRSRARRLLRRERTASIPMAVVGRSTDRGTTRGPVRIRFDALARR